MKSCQTCKTWKDCDGRDWYDYPDIRWCPYQVIWILFNSEELEIGYWPDNPKVKSAVLKGEAYYAKVVGILAEVRVRLVSTKKRGDRFVLDVMEGKEAKELNEESWSVLMYVKGWGRKRQTFSQWLADRNYRSRKRLIYRKTLT